MLTALIVTIFTLSTVPVEDLYTRARLQVEIAKSIDWLKYEDWLKARIEPVKEARIEEIFNRESTQTYGSHASAIPLETALKKMESVKVKNGVIVNPEVLTELNIVLDVTIETITNWSQSSIDYILQTETTPLDVLRFIQSTEATRDAVLYTISFEEAEQELWKNISQNLLSSDRYSANAILATQALFDATVGLYAPTEVMGIPEARLYLDIDGDWLELDSFDPLLKVRIQGRDQNIESNIPPHLQSAPDTSIAIWLSETYPALGQINTENIFIPFAGLAHVWREIADRPLSDASLYLDALAAEEKRNGDSVTMLGLSIPAPLVPVAGPLAIMLLLIQMSRLLTFIQQRADKQSGVVNEFPWLVLHAKRFWLADPIISLIALPLFMQLFIHWKFRDSELLWVNTGWTITCVSIISSIIVCNQLMKLRRIISVVQT